MKEQLQLEGLREYPEIDEQLEHLLSLAHTYRVEVVSAGLIKGMVTTDGPFLFLRELRGCIDYLTAVYELGRLQVEGLLPLRGKPRFRRLSPMCLAVRAWIWTKNRVLFWNRLMDWETSYQLSTMLSFDYGKRSSTRTVDIARGFVLPEHELFASTPYYLVLFLLRYKARKPTQALANLMERMAWDERWEKAELREPIRN